MVLSRIDGLQRLGRLLGMAGLLFLIATGIGCGSLSNGSDPSNSRDPLHLGANYGPLGSPTPSTIQIRMGSEPSDRVVSLSLTLDSLDAINSGSAAMPLLSSPVTVELAHSAVATDPISIQDIYQDTYSALVFPAMTGSITFYDNNGQLVVQAISVPAQTVLYTFVLGPSPTVLNVWVDIAQSFTITDSGNARLTLRRSKRYQPAASVVSGSSLVVTAESETPNPAVGQPESGSITFLVGTVSSVDLVNKKIAIQPASGDATQVLYSDTGTNFESCTPATLTGLLVEMAGVTQSDGSVFATEVEWTGNPTDSQLYGVFSGYNPSGLFAMVVEGGDGVNVNSSLVGKKITVDWLDAIYTVNTSGLIDMSNTSLAFDSNYVYPGQFVEVEGDTLAIPDTDSCSLNPADPPCNAGIMQPFIVELQQQTITGTVSGLTYNPLTQTGSFSLTPAGNAALRIQNPGLAVTVNQVPQTYLRNLSSGFANGDVVKVRGLLFSTTPNGGYIPSVSNPVNFVLVAGRISR